MVQNVIPANYIHDNPLNLLLAQIAAVKALHLRDTGERECGARHVATVKHSNGSVSARRLLCTEKVDSHGPHHRDALCCYTFHQFDQVEAYEPRNMDRCAHDGQTWPCQTIRAIESAQA